MSTGDTSVKDKEFKPENHLKILIDSAKEVVIQNENKPGTELLILLETIKKEIKVAEYALTICDRGLINSQIYELQKYV